MEEDERGRGYEGGTRTRGRALECVDAIVDAARYEERAAVAAPREPDERIGERDLLHGHRHAARHVVCEDPFGLFERRRMRVGPARGRVDRRVRDVDARFGLKFEVVAAREHEQRRAVRRERDRRRFGRIRVAVGAQARRESHERRARSGGRRDAEAGRQQSVVVGRRCRPRAAAERAREDADGERSRNQLQRNVLLLSCGTDFPA